MSTIAARCRSCSRSSLALRLGGEAHRRVVPIIPSHFRVLSSTSCPSARAAIPRHVYPKENNEGQDGRPVSRLSDSSSGRGRRRRDRERRWRKDGDAPTDPGKRDPFEEAVNQTRKVLPPDFPGLETALQTKNCITAWLKLHDILLDADARGDLKAWHFRALLAILLKTSQDGPAPKFEYADQILATMTQQAIEPTTEDYNLYLSAYAAIGDMAAARGILMRLQQNKLEPNMDTYNTFLRMYANTGNLDAAVAFFNRMLQEGIAPNVATFNELIACCKSKPETADRYYSEMLDLAYEPDHRTLALLIKIHATHDDMERAEKLLMEMESRNLRPDRYDYAIIMNGYRRKQQWGKICDLYTKVADSGVKLDAFLYNNVIHALTKQGELDDAAALTKDMTRRRVDPDAVTYTTLIGAFCKAGRLAEAERVLKTLRESNVDRQRTHVYASYQFIINAHSEAGDIDEAIRVFTEMRTVAEIWPTVQCYNLILQCAAKKFRPDILREYWDLLRAQEPHTVANHATYAIVIEGFCAARDLANAMDVFRDMIHRTDDEDATKSLTASFELYEALLDCALRLRSYTDAATIITHARQNKTYASRPFTGRFEAIRDELELQVITMGRELDTLDFPEADHVSIRDAEAIIDREQELTHVILTLYAELTLFNRPVREKTYRAALESARRRRDFLRCIHIYMSLEAASRNPDHPIILTAQTVTVMLRAVLEQSGRNSAKAWADMIAGRGEPDPADATEKRPAPYRRPLNREGYGYLLTLHMRGGSASDAISTLLDMKAAGYEPTHENYTRAMHAADAFLVHDSDKKKREANLPKRDSASVASRLRHAQTEFAAFVEEMFPELLGEGEEREEERSEGKRLSEKLFG
ncbi:uncharacterized protein EV422DRAFT_398291 [Fimicolochytrium jonesii]|uniref:uncharacterized protein n=1 Tax=Fimicolochytrium jonesii TaxID=1396493 RepID=UPI0022FDB654|nr:uncharacterized protein EV422DRAFT_398291 [Fimicolochytrium jonesii]KAI8822441.1 hypothetical protein EV422DRAFT_398291 [Fimicolochytrium jonesii]